MVDDTGEDASVESVDVVVVVVVKFDVVVITDGNWDAVDVVAGVVDEQVVVGVRLEMDKG